MSTKISKYLNQTVQWEKCSGHDEYGKAKYEDAKEVMVRKVDAQKLVVDDYGKQIVANTTVLTTEDISVGDLIDGDRIVSVESAVDRWGRVVGKQGLLMNN